MQYDFDEQLILTPNVNNSFAHHRNVRIKSTKLPHDFFKNLKEHRYTPNPLSERTIDVSDKRRPVRTPTFSVRKQ